MTKQEWLATCKEHEDELESLIDSWHPASYNFGKTNLDLPITAPGAEAACEHVRKEIYEETTDDRPSQQFLKALIRNDVKDVYTLLSAAWFGVPESTGCWHIKGFGLACDLLDDPPED